MIFASSLAASFFSATFSTLHCRVPAMNKSQGLLVLYGGTQAWFHTGTVSFQDYKQEIRSLVPGHLPLRLLDHFPIDCYISTEMSPYTVLDTTTCDKSQDPWCLCRIGISPACCCKSLLDFADSEAHDQM